MEYVFRKEIVARSLARLRAQKTHTSFTGYLCLQQRTSLLGRLEDLQPEFLQFFRQFFFVGNHPVGTPFIKPFTEQTASTQNLWLNKNVAGSYAPSSMRPGQPFRQVVDITKGKYSLPIEHAQKAFTYLLYSTPIQAADLAVVLYRDYGFKGNNLTINDIIDVFNYEFGYSDGLESKPNDNFRLLYSLETAMNWEIDWLETV